MGIFHHITLGKVRTELEAMERGKKKINLRDYQR